ncbi:MAG: phenylacetate--CoA ligase family protein, partial [Acidimicrobiales bacterium]
ISSLADLRRLPSYSVDDIRESLERCPPYGDYQGVRLDDPSAPVRMYFSGGTTGRSRPTIYTMWDMEVAGVLAARAYWMAGLRPRDVVLNAWAYSTHYGAAMADTALFRVLGAIPLSTSSGAVTPSTRQVQFAAEFGAASILAIGDYLLHLAGVARELGLDPRRDFAIKGFPGPASGLSAQLTEAWGVPAFESYGTHEVGYVAAECPEGGGMHINEDAFVVDIVDVDTGEAVPDGEPGNIVFTCLYKTGSSQVRYNTLDRSRLMSRQRCACGSWLRKMDNFLGRSDLMVKLRGTNIWPEGVGRVVVEDERTAEEWFVTVSREGARDEMTVIVESAVESGTWASLSSDLENRLRAQLGAKINVRVVGLGDLSDLTGRATLAKPNRFRDDRPVDQDG